MSDDTSDESDPRGTLTVRISAMPADTNANGDIFGGWVLSQMDLAGGTAMISSVSIGPPSPTISCG